jgi:hypothetical protein
MSEGIVSDVSGLIVFTSTAGTPNPSAKLAHLDSGLEAVGLDLKAPNVGILVFVIQVQVMVPELHLVAFGLPCNHFTLTKGT